MPETVNFVKTVKKKKEGKGCKEKIRNLFGASAYSIKIKGGNLREIMHIIQKRKDGFRGIRFDRFQKLSIINPTITK